MQFKEFVICNDSKLVYTPPYCLQLSVHLLQNSAYFLRGVIHDICYDTNVIWEQILASFATIIQK